MNKDDIKSSNGYGKYILDEFELDYGRLINDVHVEYTTRGTPKYDDDGNIINAVIYCHEYNGNCSSIGNFYGLIGDDGILADYDFFYISITSFGFPDSCSPSTTNLRHEFPSYSIKDCVNFKRKFLAEKFNITHVLGIAGKGLGGYEVYTWACEYPDEMDFIIVGGSSFKTSSYRYISAKIIESIIDSSDAFYENVYNESLSKIMVSINKLIYSHYFSHNVFQNLSNDEIDVLMDDFVDEGLFIDIYDIKFRNDSVLRYDMEDKLHNIKAKTLVISASNDIYYIPEFEICPLKDSIEDFQYYVVDSDEYFNDDSHSKVGKVLHDFLEEFKF